MAFIVHRVALSFLSSGAALVRVLYILRYQGSININKGMQLLNHCE